MSSNKSGKGEHHRGGPGGLDCRATRPTLLLDPNPCLPVVPCTGQAGSPLPLGEGRGEGAAVYRDIPGFCRSATLEEIRQKGYVLTPGRYVGAPEQQEQDEPFEAKTSRLFVRLEEQQPKAAKLVAALIANLKELGDGH
jgi:type I restriction-modification system DNA methylase subunit